MAAAPLSHLRVVELTDIRGALAGRLLADLGARVVKVEPPEGDAGRRRPPFARDIAGPDRSLAFLYRNANKHGVVIDPTVESDRDRLEELLDRADVFVENLSAADAERWRIDRSRLRTRHPHLVHLTMADFGLSGPRASWRAEPLAAFAASGALHASGFADHPPCWLPGFIAHDCASIFGVAGVLAAELARAHRGGEGQAVEVSVQEAALNGLYLWAPPLPDYARMHEGLPASPPRNADGSYLVLPTSDGFVRVLAGTLRQWRGFLTLIGNPTALSGPEWELPILRLAATDVIRQIAGEALVERTTQEVFHEALRLRVPLSPVHRPEAFVAAEQTRVRGFFSRTGFPHLGDAPFAPAPLNFSATPVVLSRAAPELGEGLDLVFERPTGAAATVEQKKGRAADAPPLAGMRVINLGVGAVVPEAGWLLAEMGAEVIKIESRANLDFLRAVTIEPDTPNRAWTFNSESRGQKSVLLDIGTPRGRDLALRLCATANVVLENNRGGVVEAWGLDYESVRAVRPDVIYLASQGFGRGGPLGEAPAYGPLNSSFSGANFLWNHPDTPYPAGSSLNHPDHIASKLAACAVLAAIEHHRRTGEGQFIEMAQTEAAAYLQGEYYLLEPLTGRRAERAGNSVPYAAPHGVYRCADDEKGGERWCAIAVVGDDAFARFEACLGSAADPDMARLEARLAAREELDRRVGAWTRDRKAEDVAETLQAAGVSAMAVLGPEDLRADEHLAERGAIAEVQHAEVGTEHHCGNPIRTSATRLVPAGPAPLLGEHTEAVLTRCLGLTPEEVARLAEEGVCR